MPASQATRRPASPSNRWSPRTAASLLDTPAFSAETVKLEALIHEQSGEIAAAVDRDEGAGDQGLMFGYAFSDTSGLMPAALVYSHQVLEQLARRRKSDVPLLGPDARRSSRCGWSTANRSTWRRSSSQTSIERASQDFRSSCARASPRWFPLRRIETQRVRLETLLKYRQRAPYVGGRGSSDPWFLPHKTPWSEDVPWPFAEGS